MYVFHYVVTYGNTGAWPYNRPCAQQYVDKSQSCMVISRRLIVHAPVYGRYGLSYGTYGLSGAIMCRLRSHPAIAGPPPPHLQPARWRWSGLWLLHNRPCKYAAASTENRNVPQKPQTKQASHLSTHDIRVRVQLIRHCKTCMTDIYLQS